MLISVDHLGTPVWGVLSASAVLGFDRHQLCDLAAGDYGGVWLEGFRGYDGECLERTVVMHVARLEVFQPLGVGCELH
jgi:hypothetical protein